ncbi:nicotinate-nucleotide--dimethylbenzimidazole phosphoribosyltransferase [Klebsiella quasipneumoniae]|uniref:nicotinate-nucleotide--dimethylbenzimidazole phosphoribosyltransferase n=1 Tax=Klebsiella quasipneumoniae TaxID=1463165 RepID=UPI001DD82C6D|nr:nicotinate-nucleotide--dimethylbenzimidazole phosphoribosyltransferase [Klebsiella quasipneumoniae]CAF3200374.1 Nicotinate-nucleotide--dimethylbenzimidazole phosphoribosyltransferase [Klebsiella quasipneumoniae]CAH5642720.1 Nicotinate-nucleotide--dimethylbenzimidazole phosphoribosyltransferase [Klebsiella quasipneumoniae]HCI6859994.1 nicotinate-nucleotide--dimethylbenzimidazole phosphoribosyltransferase [Klebsiella quasipneumoniae subsp. similipneumoniae]
MDTLSALLAAIPQPDVAGMARAQQHIDGLLKPPGSLGRLESLAVQLAGLPGLQGQLALSDKAIVVMCADHGVWHEGVTPSPQAVTAIHAGNMVRGNTGVCVLAAQAGVRVEVVDVGIDAEPLPGLINLKVARGSGNIARAAAMSRQQAETVLLASMRFTRQLAADGVKVFGVGELGMANTTPAAATISVLTGSDPDAVVGCGANLPLAQRGHKVAVVRQAIVYNQPNPADGLDVLAKVGGFDLVGMSGVILGAASCGLPVVLDGFLSYASALAACRMAPAAHPYLIPSHLSAEKGARIALDALGLRPYLDMDMRLGEGSGAALAMHLLDAASAMYHQMGTLAQSNIVLSDSAPTS